VLFNGQILAEAKPGLIWKSTPLFPQGFQTGKPLAFCGWLAEKGALEGPLFLIFQQLVPGLKPL